MNNNEEQPVIEQPKLCVQTRIKSLFGSSDNKKKLMLSLLVVAVAVGLFFFIKKKKIPTEIPDAPISS
jgi:hypothetical protein